jgi:hypothetical protein
LAWLRNKKRSLQRAKGRLRLQTLGSSASSLHRPPSPASLIQIWGELTTPKESQNAPELRSASPGWNDCLRDRFDQKTLEMGEVDFVVEAMKLLLLRANRAS